MKIFNNIQIHCQPTLILRYLDTLTERTAVAEQSQRNGLDEINQLQRENQKLRDQVADLTKTISSTPHSRTSKNFDTPDDFHAYQGVKEPKDTEISHVKEKINILLDVGYGSKRLMWHHKKGDEIKRGQVIASAIAIKNNDYSASVAAPFDGFISELHFPDGFILNGRTLIGYLTPRK